MRDGTVTPNGNAVKRLRTERGWSQEEMATKADCAKRTIEHIESGKPVYRKTLAAIATALGSPVQVIDLLARHDEVADAEQPPGPTPSVARAGNAPPLPSLLIGREGDLIRLTDSLTRDGENGDATPTQRLTIVRGWAGVGKTTITRALAHWPEISTAFPDGVLWTALGKSPSILAELIAWGRALGDKDLSRMALSSP